MNYSSYQLFSQLCVSTIHVNCVYEATRRVVCAGRWSSRAWPSVCVCGSSNVGHYRLSHRAASVGVQCNVAARTTLCSVALLTACDVAYMQLRCSAVVTLMTSATAAVASLVRALPCAFMRVYMHVYVCTPILYNTSTDCMPTCALYRQCTAAAAALGSVCQSVSGDCY